MPRAANHMRTTTTGAATMDTLAAQLLSCLPHNCRCQPQLLPSSHRHPPTCSPPAHLNSCVARFCITSVNPSPCRIFEARASAVDALIWRMRSYTSFSRSWAASCSSGVCSEDVVVGHVAVLCGAMRCGAADKMTLATAIRIKRCGAKGGLEIYCGALVSQ
jgi:hypothetical protein